MSIVNPGPNPNSHPNTNRFSGQKTIPGLHIRYDLPKGRLCNIRCQVCRATGTSGSKKPPRAKFVCRNPVCGGISFCSMRCDSIWHVHPDVLKTIDM